MMNPESQTRTAKGEWLPNPLPYPSPLFYGPWRPLGLLKSLWNVIWPYNLFYAALAYVCWLYLTPSLETTTHFNFGWIALLYLRNVVLLTLIAGGLHLRLYLKQAQGLRFKYTNKWLASKDSKFSFGNQTLDNVFWSLVSGCLVWTGFEALSLWAYANHIIPYFDMRAHPVYAALLVLGVVYLRYFHFYFVHRLIHWKPLYKSSHYLHHRNINIGPWSGLSMHPIEHLLYFSSVFFLWIIPAGPFYAIFNLLHAGVSPALGHNGFHELVVKDDVTMKADHYFHYLHHRLFTVNFGVQELPLDWLFNTQCDGSPESLARITMERRGKAAKGKSSSPGPDDPSQ
jgi:sterol desaturase/sphingolipid hydroxylase (fatty acid hydroxylase superfamily)